MARAGCGTIGASASHDMQSSLPRSSWAIGLGATLLGSCDGAGKIGERLDSELPASRAGAGPLRAEVPLTPGAMPADSREAPGQCCGLVASTPEQAVGAAEPPAPASCQWSYSQHVIAAGAPRGMGLVWNGNAYAVTWFDIEPARLRFAHVDRAGETQGEPMLLHQGYGASAALAWNGAGYGLLKALSSTLGFVPISAAGPGLNFPARSNDVEVAPAAVAVDLQLLATPEGYGVLWQVDAPATSSSQLALLETSGSPRSIAALAPDATHTRSPRAAWNGDGFGLTWADDHEGGTHVYFRELDARGNPRTPATRISSEPAELAHPDIVWTGTEYGLAWMARSETGALRSRFVRVARSAQILGTGSDWPEALAGIAGFGEGFALLLYRANPARDLLHPDPALGRVSTPVQVRLVTLSAEGTALPDTASASLSASSIGRPLIGMGTRLAFSWSDGARALLGFFDCVEPAAER
jgi:hypothetical protein